MVINLLKKFHLLYLHVIIFSNKCILDSNIKIIYNIKDIN